MIKEMIEISESNFNTKRKMIFLWVGVLFLFVLLALSIENLNFLPGNDFSFEFHLDQTPNYNPDLGLQFDDFSVITGIAAFILGAGVLVLIGRFLILLRWRSVAAGLIIILGLIVVLNIPNPQYRNQGEAPSQIEQEQSVFNPVIRLPEPEEEGDTEIIILLIVPLIILAFVLLRRLNQAERPGNHIGDIFSEAIKKRSSTAYDEMDVLDLYRNLILYIEEKEIVEMADYMTASEFARVLIDLGLPDEPVEKISALFEKARYSPRKLTSRENDEVFECTAEIYDVIQKAG